MDKPTTRCVVEDAIDKSKDHDITRESARLREQRDALLAACVFALEHFGSMAFQSKKTLGAAIIKQRIDAINRGGGE